MSSLSPPENLTTLFIASYQFERTEQESHAWTLRKTSSGDQAKKEGWEKDWSENPKDDLLAEDTELVNAWKVLDDLGADEALRRNTDALEYLANGRSDKILLDVEELLGGHSKARHGSQIPLTEMEQRVLGTHPTMPQSRSALKFNSDAIHEASVNKAFKEHKSEIEAHFASGGGYKEWDSQLSGNIGDGYYN